MRTRIPRVPEPVPREGTAHTREGFSPSVLITLLRDLRPFPPTSFSRTLTNEEDEGIFVPRQRDRMQTPKLRPLLPTSYPPAYLQSAMFPANSLFKRIFRITPTRSAAYAQILRNSIKTRNFGGGGEGGYPSGCPFACVALSCPSQHTPGAPPLSPAFGDRVGALVLLVALTALPAFSQQPITDPTKVQSKNVENMQNFTIEKLYMTRSIGGSTWSPDGKQLAFVTNISGRNNIWL